MNKINKSLVMDDIRPNINITDFARPSILKLKPYASAKDEFKDFDKDLIFLDANENPYENGLNRYPDPNQTKLKNVISEIKGIPLQNILLGNGSDEILDMVFRVFCEPSKDNAIISIPTFGMYKVLADINNVTCKKVLLTTDFQLDVENIIKIIDKNTKIILICSPNNPTGNLMAKEDVLKLLLLPVLVVIDEAYIDFSDAKSWLNEIGNYNNLIVTQTLSKAFGLAGIRLGICYASDKIIELLQKIKMPYNVSVLTQIKATKSLEEVVNIRNEIDLIIRNKSNLFKELLKFDLVIYIYNSDTNFLLVKVDDANIRYAQLLEKGIVVRNRTNEPLCENCLRITVGTEQDNENLIKALRSLN